MLILSYIVCKNIPTDSAVHTADITVIKFLHIVIV